MKVADIKNVAGIGGGVIGGSWAVLFAMKGLNVKLYDINDDCLANDKKTIVSNLEFLTENGAIEDKDAVLARIQFTTSMEEAVKDAQFIQESGPERLPIKHSMLAEIEKYAPVDAIVATSASGLPLGQITEHAVHPERCVGGHPYNPPHLIPLVEITKTEKTDEANVELAKEFYESLGKEAIVLKKDCPGYICNRRSDRRGHVSIFPPGDSGILRHALYRGQWQQTLFHRGRSDHTVLRDIQRAGQPGALWRGICQRRTGSDADRTERGDRSREAYRMASGEIR